MCNWVMLGYVAVLFFLLTPGVVLRLPPKGGKIMVAFVHAIVFAVVFHFSHKMFWNLSNQLPV